MNTTSSSRSVPARRSLGGGGFLNQRVLIGLVVVLAAVLLSLIGFGPTTAGSTQVRNAKQSRTPSGMPAGLKLAVQQTLARDQTPTGSWEQEQELTAVDGAADDWFGRSVAIDGDTALVGADGVDVGGSSNQGAAYVFVRSGNDWIQQARLTASDGAQFNQFGFAVALSGNTALIGTAANVAYVFTREGETWTEQARLTASDGAPDDNFGIAVALMGNTAVIGARQADVGGNMNQGAAYVFVGSGNTWTEQAKLTASDGAAFDVFGDAVALDGDTVVVGAAFADSGGNENQGAAYVFIRDGETWSEQAKLLAGDGVSEDWFGSDVAVSGDTALIAAQQAAVDGHAFQGAAYVFTRDGATWSQQAKLTADDGASGDTFGESVALLGDTALVGALFADNTQGAAYIFTRANQAWSQELKLTAADGSPGDQFGKSVAIDGNGMLVGAWTAKVEGNASQGAAYIFGKVQFEEQKFTASDGADGDRFGISVAIDGDTALVGALLAAVNGHSAQGAAYVFERSGDTWSQVQKLVATDGAAFDRFGASVSLEGDTALIGGWGAAGQRGAAWVFTRSGGTWTQQARLDASDGATNDFLGQSVALSGDTAIAGAWGAEIGGNAEQGAAYIFTRSGTTWSQQTKLTAPDGMPNDSFGQTVSLDGDTALAGAPFAKVGDNFLQGAAYVFTRSGATWSLQTKLTANDGQPLDRLGFAVALDGNTALCSALGASFDDEANRGAAYVFTFAGGNWTQQAKLGASDGVPFDDFGQSVALTGDTVVVGADFATVGKNTFQGAAYVFARSGEQWTEQVKLVASDGAANDDLGISVATDGQRAMAGAWLADVNGTADQGAAYVFVISDGTPTPTPTPTATGTPTITPTPSPSGTPTPTATATPTATPIPTPTATPTATATPTPTPTPTITPTPTPTATPIPTPRPSPTPRSRPTPRPRPSPPLSLRQ